MKQYKDLLTDIVENGKNTSDRTGVGTRSIFGRQLRFNLALGYPLVTLKKTFTKAVIHELLWFIKGSTNALELQANGVSIWDEWMVSEDTTRPITLTPYDRLVEFARQRDITIGEARGIVTNVDSRADTPDGAAGLRYLDEQGIPTHTQVDSVRKGELGPVYGKQWRDWTGLHYDPISNTRQEVRIDQLAWAIERLKTKPTCRRIIVSAWNPADLPRNDLSPSENAAHGYMALAACHTMFQFYAEELSEDERVDIFNERHPKWNEQHEREMPDFDALEIPKYKLSCQLYQRSADVTLGVPFNIASYALLTHMVAQVVNMVPGDFIHTFGDAHIYLDHFESNNPNLPDGGVETLLKREPIEKLPTLWLNPAIKNIDDFTFNDIRIDGYESHSRMRFPVAV